MALQLGGQKTFKNVQYQPSNGPHDTKLTFSPSRNDTDNTYIVYISNEDTERINEGENMVTLSKETLLRQSRFDY
ncbi:4241_t:CDS:2 [Entrophospora sp. SA101]|nr:6967_t:CDS:2 [Entrophospora sp. SA101]CAJ0634210.1 4241_t:CDS:2 [Entrophospora sp. SA101]CAJ0841125.1 1796_t:CDS:2 [Entrophospora sp. SA101]CAJ0849463.1 1852_t:CDS:2 [Entrophospora sp. SA101]CAJ0865696.1 18098_t:CDS:2 [Entrophospora sp. SA101]